MGPHGIKQILKNLNQQEIAQLRSHLLSENVEQLGLSPDQVLGILQALEEEVPEPDSFLGQTQAGLCPPRLAEDVAQLLNNWTTIFGSNAPPGIAQGYQEMPRRKRFAEAMSAGDAESEMLAIQERVDMLEREKAHLLQQLHVSDQPTYAQHPVAASDMDAQRVKRPRMDESFAFTELGYQVAIEGNQALTGAGGTGVAVSQANQQRGGKQKRTKGNNGQKFKGHNRGQQQPQRGYQMSQGRNQDGGWEQYAGSKYSAADQGQQSYNLARGGKQTGFGRQTWGKVVGQTRGKQQAGHGQDARGRGRTQNKLGRGRGKNPRERMRNRGRTRGRGKPGMWGGVGRGQTKRQSNNQSERRNRTGSRDRFHERPRSNERQIDDYGVAAQEGPDDYYGSRRRFYSGDDNQDVGPDCGNERGHFEQDDYRGDDYRGNDYVGFGDDYRDEKRDDDRRYQDTSSHCENDLRCEDDLHDYQPRRSDEFIKEVYRDVDHHESGRSRKASFHDEDFIHEGRERSKLRPKREKDKRGRTWDEDKTSQDNRRQSLERMEDYQKDTVAKQGDQRAGWEEDRESGYAYDRPADTRVWDDVDAEIERRHWEDEMLRRQASIERSVEMEMRSLPYHRPPILFEPPLDSLSPPGIFHSPPLMPESISRRSHLAQFGDDGLQPLPTSTIPSLFSIKTQHHVQRGQGRKRYSGRRQGQASTKMNSRARDINELRQRTAARVTGELAKLLLKRPLQELPKRSNADENKERQNETKEKKDEKTTKLETDSSKADNSMETKEGTKVAKSAETLTNEDSKATPKDPRMPALMHQLRILEAQELQGFLHRKVVSLCTCYICNTTQSCFSAYKSHTSLTSHNKNMQNCFGPDSYNERERVASRLRKLPDHSAFTPEQLKAYPQGDRAYFCSSCCIGYTCSTEEHWETEKHKHFEANRLQCTACNLYFGKLKNFRTHLQGELHKKIAELIKKKGNKHKESQKQQDKTVVSVEASVAKKKNQATAEPAGAEGKTGQQTISKKPKTTEGTLAPSSRTQEGVIKSSTPSTKSSTQVVCTEPSKGKTAEDILGLELVIPVSGFFCKCCSKFYNDKYTAKMSHCRTELHRQKALQWYKTEGKKGKPSITEGIESQKTQEVIEIDDDDDDNKEDENKKSKNREADTKTQEDKMQSDDIPRMVESADSRIEGESSGSDEHNLVIVEDQIGQLHTGESGDDLQTAEAKLGCDTPNKKKREPTGEQVQGSWKPDKDAESLEEGELVSEEELSAKAVKPLQETKTYSSEKKDHLEVMDIGRGESLEDKVLSTDKKEPLSEVHLKASPDESGSQVKKTESDVNSEDGQQAKKSIDDVSQGDDLYGDLEEEIYQKEDDDDDDDRYLEPIGTRPRTEEEEIGDLDDDDDEMIFAIDEEEWEVRSEEGGCTLTSDEEQKASEGGQDDAEDGSKEEPQDLEPSVVADESNNVTS